MDQGAMSARGRRWVVVGVCLLTLTLSSGARAASPQAKPNLVVTSLIIEGLGHNPYLVVPHSGKVPNIRVRVVTRNIGHGPSPPSKTDVFLFGKPRQTHYASPDFLSIPALAPGERATRTAILKGVMPHLGLVHVEADADFARDVQESDQGDNRRTSPELPVIARTWDVSSLTSYSFGGPVLGVDEHTEPGFFFRFQHLDVGTGRFIYSATGAIDASNTSVPAGCTGTGSGSTGHAPWPIATSYFAISFGVDHYFGAIEAANDPGFQVPLTCGQGTAQVTVTYHFLNLRIGSAAGPVSLYPANTHINGSAEQSGFGGTIDYGFGLRADVP